MKITKEKFYDFCTEILNEDVSEIGTYNPYKKNQGVIIESDLIENDKVLIFVQIDSTRNISFEKVFSLEDLVNWDKDLNRIGLSDIDHYKEFDKSDLINIFWEFYDQFEFNI